MNKILQEIWFWVYCEEQKFIRFIATTNYRKNIDKVKIFHIFLTKYSNENLILEDDYLDSY